MIQTCEKLIWQACEVLEIQVAKSMSQNFPALQVEWFCAVLLLSLCNIVMNFGWPPYALCNIMIIRADPLKTGAPKSVWICDKIAKKKKGGGGGSFWTMFKNVQNWYIGSSFIIIEVKEKYSLVLLWGRGGGANFFFPFPGWEQLSLAFLHIHQSLLYTMLLHCTCCELWTKTLITLSVTFSLAKLCFRFSFQKMIPSSWNSWIEMGPFTSLENGDANSSQVDPYCSTILASQSIPTKQTKQWW